MPEPPIDGSLLLDRKAMSQAIRHYQYIDASDLADQLADDRTLQGLLPGRAAGMADDDLCDL